MHMVERRRYCKGLEISIADSSGPRLFRELFDSNAPSRVLFTLNSSCSATIMAGSRRRSGILFVERCRSFVLLGEHASSSVETTSGVSGLEKGNSSWFVFIPGGPVPERFTCLDWESEKGEIFDPIVNIESRTAARVDPE